MIGWWNSGIFTNAIFYIIYTFKVCLMDIHKLQAFVAVVEESNISKAAVRLHMQQPPLTRLIKSLEEELNTALLKRLPRGVEVTEAGKVLYQEAITILALPIQQDYIHFYLRCYASFVKSFLLWPFI